MAKTIIVNEEALVELLGRFESVNMYIDNATEYAERAERAILDAGTCRALKNTMRDGIAKLIIALKEIIKTFTNIDIESADDADEITNPPGGGNDSWVDDVGGSNHDSGNGSDGGSHIESSSQSEYSTAIQNYISSNLDHLRGINEGNYTSIIGCDYRGDRGWCDAFVDYVVRMSGMHSPGTTNQVTTTIFEQRGLRHGLKYDNGTWDEFNNIYGSHVSNDGYQPQTGDLVWGSHAVTTNHVGIYYIDPNTGAAYVIEGSAPDIVSVTPAQEFYNRYRHISFGDMSTYNAMVNSGQI